MSSPSQCSRVSSSSPRSDSVEVPGKMKKRALSVPHMRVGGRQTLGAALAPSSSEGVSELFGVDG